MSFSSQQSAEFVRSRIPSKGLFAGMDWRISPEPFPVDGKIIAELQRLGRVLLQFYRGVNLLYRKHSGSDGSWVTGWLDKGKPDRILQLQRSGSFKNQVPRVIRPDILLTDEGLKLTELDSVPGGIGVTGWLNKTYSDLRAAGGEFEEVVGEGEGMQNGFASIFPNSGRVHIVVSQESATYVPEMEWLADQIDRERFQVRDTDYKDFNPGEHVYRFFELFDLENVGSADVIFDRAEKGELTVTAPPKAFLEEKMLLALLWNRNLHEFWRQELGEGFFRKMLELTPYSWVVDPSPLPAHGAIPELNLTHWQQLNTLSQKERNLILKVSGFSESAWGARGVYLGSDLPLGEWSQAVDRALKEFQRNPFVLQRYHKPKTVEVDWFDFEAGVTRRMEGRVRLCPYYFVEGQGDAARPRLCGVLATICPADKKIIHGMKDAVLAPVVPRKD